MLELDISKCYRLVDLRNPKKLYKGKIVNQPKIGLDLTIDLDDRTHHFKICRLQRILKCSNVFWAEDGNHLKFILYPV